MTRKRDLAAQVLLSVLVSALLVGCGDHGDEPDPSTAPRHVAPQPNGVAHMKPERAMTVARKAMEHLHDAVYVSNVAVEIDGTRRRMKVVETLTRDGCAREVRHPKYGHIWIRVLGRTMWLKTDDQASETLGRTPAQTEIFRGRWIKGAAPELIRDCDLDYLLSPSDLDEYVEAGERTKVGRRPGRRFTATGGGLSLSFVIATRGRPIVLSSRLKTPADLVPGFPAGMSYDGTAVLDGVNTGAVVEPPPDRFVIDPALLQTDTV